MGYTQHGKSQRLNRNKEKGGGWKKEQQKYRTTRKQSLRGHLYIPTYQ